MTVGNVVYAKIRDEKEKERQSDRKTDRQTYRQTLKQLWPTILNLIEFQTLDKSCGPAMRIIKSTFIVFSVLNNDAATRFALKSTNKS